MTAKRMFVFVLIVAFSLTVPCLAQETATAVDAELLDFVKKHRQAFQAKDIDAIMALYAPGDEAVLLGTGPGERYVGQDEIRAAHIAFFKTYDTEESTITWHKVWLRGDTALMAVQIHVTSYDKNEKSEFAINWTGAVEKKDGKWMILYRHFSNLFCD